MRYHCTAALRPASKESARGRSSPWLRGRLHPSALGRVHVPQPSGQLMRLLRPHQLLRHLWMQAASLRTPQVSGEKQRCCGVLLWSGLVLSRSWSWIGAACTLR